MLSRQYQTDRLMTKTNGNIRYSNQKYFLEKLKLNYVNLQLGTKFFISVCFGLGFTRGEGRGRV